MTDSLTNNSRVDPDRWVDTYGDSLHSYAYFRLQDRALAEELVQETFVSALKTRALFRGDSSEKSWLFSILRNKIVDHLRWKYREKARPVESLPEAASEEFFDPRGDWLTKPAKWRGNPQQRYEQREFLAVVLRCLTGLSATQRDAFVLREFEDVGGDEICKVLGISPTNYWVLLHRARLVIRRCLERIWFGNSTETGGRG